MSWFVLACCAGGCGGTHNLAQSVRPAAPTGREALDEKECRIAADATEPLVVDWNAEQRGDLELGMKQGVAVVAYDCQKMRVLRDCHIEGSYGFLGMTTKEQMVRLENADEIQANLPLNGAVLVAKLGAELEAGSSLDIALVLVGKKRTTWANVTPADLHGTCAGATHYVRGAMVGAFAMQTGARANMRSVAQVFGIGAEGASKSSKNVSVRDGKLDECKTAAPDALTPPAQCGVPVRLELIPISEKLDTTARDDDDTDDAVSQCPTGRIWRDGKCMSAQTRQNTQCRYGEALTCEQQCAQGQAESCTVLGRMYRYGRKVQKSYANSAAFYEKGCTGGSQRGCHGLALRYLNGQGVPKDALRSFGLMNGACDGGYADACNDLGFGYTHGQWPGGADVTKGLLAYHKACNGGAAQACGNLGTLYSEGRGVELDPQRAVTLFRQACDGRSGLGCYHLAMSYGEGKPLPKDDARVVSLLKLSCDLQSAYGCAELGACYEKGTTVAPDLARAVELYSQACDSETKFEHGCLYLGRLYLEGRGVKLDPNRGMSLLRKSCAAKSHPACNELKKLGESP